MDEQGFGATGRYPEGRLGPDDMGELRAGLTVVQGKLVLAFGKSVSWLAMTPDQADALADALKARAREARKEGGADA